MRVLFRTKIFYHSTSIFAIAPSVTLQLVAEEDEDNSVVAEILMQYLKKYKKGC